MILGVGLGEFDSWLGEGGGGRRWRGEGGGSGGD